MCRAFVGYAWLLGASDALYRPDITSRVYQNDRGVGFNDKFPRVLQILHVYYGMQLHKI